MDYELIKELKDAGFRSPEDPTTGHYDSWTLQKTYGQAFSLNGKYKFRLFPGMTYDRSLIYIPTLSELIAACGEDLQGLLRVDEQYGGWAAVKNLMDANYDKFANGNTPKEAVARLWLKLNKK